MRRIIPGIYRLGGLRAAEVYVIRDPDGLTLVDTGFPAHAVQIMREIEGAGGCARDVRRILVTHAHPDHIGGLALLKEWTGAAVIASEIDRPVVEGLAPVPLPRHSPIGPLIRLVQLTLKATPVDQAVSDGDMLPAVMGGLRVIATPGHTPGHIAFWHPARHVLFCGDAMMHLAGLTLPMPVATVDMAEARRSIGRLAALDPAVVCLGHGPPLLAETAPRVRALARRVGAR